MYAILIAFLLLLSFNIKSQDNNLKVKTAVIELRKLIDTQKKINKNPLEAYKLDNFLSRSYLYYYRALGYSRLSENKNNSQKIIYLTKALGDLKLAKISPSAESQRLDQLINTTLKELIELAVITKKYRLIADLIEQLPHSDKKSPKYIIYYGFALFNASRHEDFARLAAEYQEIFRDEKIINNFLDSPPNWQRYISKISIPKDILKAAKPASKIPAYTKEGLLDNPQGMLEYLNKFNYFSDADIIYKLASPLYFSLSKKVTTTAKESEFVRWFERLMPSFAPSFLDELISAHWKHADLKTAEKLSESFLKQYEGNALYPKVIYNLGRIQEDAKNYPQAFAMFKRFIALSDNSSYLELARFRAPWVLYLAKKTAEAKPYFEEYLKIIQKAVMLRRVNIFC